MECGKSLGRYELENRLAFCFNCRKMMFPETAPIRAWEAKKTEKKGWKKGIRGKKKSSEIRDPEKQTRYLL
jgi:hypothetical protein